MGATTIDQEIDKVLEAVASVLIRATLVGFGILLFWFAAYLLAGEWILGIHGKLFAITPNQFDLMNYYGMTAFKGVVFFAFLLPYCCIRWTLAARRAK